MRLALRLACSCLRFGIGFAVGLFNGLLSAAGIPYHRVHGGVSLLAYWPECLPAPPPAPIGLPARYAALWPSVTPPLPPRCAASTWKGQMGLNRQGKEGSIALAHHLMPSAADQLKWVPRVGHVQLWALPCTSNLGLAGDGMQRSSHPLLPPRPAPLLQAQEGPWAGRGPAHCCLGAGRAHEAAARQQHQGQQGQRGSSGGRRGWGG